MAKAKSVESEKSSYVAVCNFIDGFGVKGPSGELPEWKKGKLYNGPAIGVKRALSEGLIKAVGAAHEDAEIAHHEVQEQETGSDADGNSDESGE